MFCPNCRNAVDEQQNFCTFCGTPLKQLPKDTPPAAWIPPGIPTGIPTRIPTGIPPGIGIGTAAGIGFSPRIDDPAFDRYKKKSKSWSLLFALILAVIAIIAFPIYGSASGEIDWPESLYYGAGIGGMFILIALVQTLRRGTDKTWDGVVIDKKTVRRSRQDNDGHNDYYTQYIVKVKKDTGGFKTHRWNDAPGFYDYYQIGERVRHHKGFVMYEKYDKTRDAQIMCAACMTFNDVRSDYCSRCKCPVLK